VLLSYGRSPNADPFEATAWLVPALLFTSALLRARATALVIVLTFGALLGADVMSGGNWSTELFDGALLLGTNATFIFILNRHRDKVEASRNKEIRARNRELEALKRSLEDRVAARTAELQKSHDELERANLDLKANQQQLVSAQKMASLGRLTAGIAHEMNSPLAAVRAGVSLSLELASEYAASVDDPSVTPEDHRAIAKEMKETLELADTAVQRAAGFVRSIKAQTRDSGSGLRVRFNAVVAVRDALQLLSHAALTGKSRLVFTPGSETLDLLGSPGRLEQVVTNLTTNAIDANADKGGGEVRISMHRVNADVVLTVSEDGPGIPAATLPKIFDPLFTTKDVGKGTGLGLTIVHDIVHGDFGGRIEIDCPPDAGTTFTIKMPHLEN
jgi:C4-dicarboxylate-specific signal transduction histidine kinase